MRITKKRAALGLAVCMLLLAGTAAGVFALMGSVGESAIEKRIGEQVKKTVNSYLSPELDFESLDYQQPRTVVLRGVRLVAADPDRPGQTIDIFEAESVGLELAEIPRPGRPLVLKTVSLQRPTIRLVLTEASGELVGFDNLVQAEPDGDAPPLSEVLQLQLIELVDAAVLLDNRQPGTQPTVIDGVTTDLRIDPADGGRYALELDLGRQPVLDAKVHATLDLDNMRLEVASAALGLTLGREQDRYLPQSVQALIKPYDLTGDLTLSASGILDLGSWQDSTLKAEAALADAHAVAGQYRVPIERLSLSASMADRLVRVPFLQIDTLGGVIQGGGVGRVDGALPFELQLEGDGLAIEQTLRPAEDGARPRYAGQAAFKLNATGRLSDIEHQLFGRGTVAVREGRVARIAVLSDLIDFMESAGDLSRPEGGAPAGRDKADVVFELRGDHAYLSKAEVVGSWFGVRGRGNLFFDQRLDMQVNAGPMEKVQDALGAVGDVFGALTDSLMAYRIGGDAAEPTIRVVPFAGLRSAPGDDYQPPPPIRVAE